MFKKEVPLDFATQPPATFLAPAAFKSNGRGRRVVVLDFETNGLNRDCSVLSATALCVYFYQGAFIVGSLFDRYYYPKEEYNKTAIAVNKLTKHRVTQLRDSVGYASQFENDRDWDQVCQWGEVFVAHNIAFDRKFMRHDPPQVFCTMVANAPILKIARHPRTKEWKWPRLCITAQHYGVAIKRHLLHFGFYDTWLCFLIFQQMFQQGDVAVRTILGESDVEA